MLVRETIGRNKKLLLMSMFVLIALAIGLIAIYLLTERETTSPTDTTSTLESERNAQISDEETLLENNELVYSVENANEIIMLANKYLDYRQYEKAVEVARLIPSGASQQDVKTKYRVLLESYRLLQRYEEYDQVRTEYKLYLESNELENDITNFEILYPDNETLQKQNENVQESEETVQ